LRKRITRGIAVLRPFSSLACFTCTDEGIYGGVALARVILVSTLVPPPRGKWWDRVLCERDEVTSLADARKKKRKLTAAVAGGQQVRCDLARVLVNRIVGLNTMPTSQAMAKE